MAFKKMSKPKFPPRRWSLIGRPGSGKSTFSLQMRSPILVIDSDQRFSEMDLAQADVYQLSEKKADNVDADTIARILARDMPGSPVQTIVIDSLTQIIAPLVTEAMLANDRAIEQGEKKNFIASFKAKALAMRRLQHAVTGFGVDSLWVWHINDAKDNKAQDVARQSISKTERARLMASLNLELHIVMDDRGRRGVKVVWARRGREGATLWDDTGRWIGMPERIEAEVYDGLTEADQERIEREPPPDHFASIEAAIAWGMQSGLFGDVRHCQNAYDKVKREGDVKSAEEMRNVWVAEIERRQAEAQEAGEAGAGQDPLFRTKTANQNHYQQEVS